MAQGFHTAGGDDLHGEAPFEIMGVEFMEERLFRGKQFLDEGEILLLLHRAVDVRGIALLITAFEIGFGEIDRILFDDGRGGVEEGKVLPSDNAGDLI